MKALQWDGRRLQLIQCYPSPKSDAATALVRVRLAGICSTDLQILQGYMGFRGIPGHEFVGQVQEGPKQFLGKRVAGEINFACGLCQFCARGLGRHCPSRRVMGILGADGSFAEYVAVPSTNLHPIPETIADEEAVFTEPLAAAFEILEQVHLTPGADVMVLGDGKLGILCAQVLHLSGVCVRVLGKHENKLGVLKNLGIETALLSNWKPAPADVVIDATGSTAGFKLAVEAVRPRGILVLKSTVAVDHSLSLAPLVINEVTVVGSRCGPFPAALRALAQKTVVVAPLIDRIYSLSEGLEAAAHAGRPGVLKILLRCA